MNRRSLASVWRKAGVAHIGEAAVIHIIDDNGSMRAEWAACRARAQHDRRRDQPDRFERWAG
jgi:hypothetical protein